MKTLSLYKDVHTVFIAVLFIIAQNRISNVHQLVTPQAKYICAVGCCVAAAEVNYLHAKQHGWPCLQNMTSSVRGLTQKMTYCFSLYEILESMYYRDNRLLGCQGLKLRGNWLQRDAKVTFSGDANCYIVILMDVIQLNTFVKTHWLVHLKLGCFILYINYTSLKFIKKSHRSFHILLQYL